MPGRPPTPIEAHKARGTLRKHRHEGKLEVPDKPLGKPPSWFTEVMREEWRRLALLGHVRDAHRVLVEHCCVLYSRFVADAKGEKAMLATERALFHSSYMQLGCTPASQAKIPAGPAKPDSSWDELR